MAERVARIDPDTLTLDEVDRLAGEAARSVARGVHRQVRAGHPLTGDDVMVTLDPMVGYAADVMRVELTYAGSSAAGALARAWQVTGQAFLDQLDACAARADAAARGGVGRPC